MAKARARTAARKVKDKWKAKQWYTLHAPTMFNKAVVGESPAEVPESLVGRVVTTTLQDMTGDFKQMHVKLDFQVTQVNGTHAESRFVGHSLTSDYVRRMVRRNHSKVFTTVDVTTKDGALVRLKPLAVTDRRTQSSQQTLIRNTMGKVLTEIGAGMTLAGLVREVLEGRAAQTVHTACKPVYPLRRVEIGKTEVRTAPTITLEDDVQVVAPPAPAEPTEGAQAEEEGDESQAQEPAEGEAAPEEPSAQESEEPAEEEGVEAEREEEKPSPAKA